MELPAKTTQLLSSLVDLGPGIHKYRLRELAGVCGSKKDTVHTHMRRLEEMKAVIRFDENHSPSWRGRFFEITRKGYKLLGRNGIPPEKKPRKIVKWKFGAVFEDHPNPKRGRPVLIRVREAI